jgi:acyl transferase domain-containing protein/acyl carrier protein
MSNSKAVDQRDGTEIAIIGMAGRFPGAASVREFWQNLRDGVESIGQLTNEQLQSMGVSEALLNDPDYVRAASVMEDVELFDASLFDISPREAELMDPQHRLFLECALSALEDAGYTAEADAGAVGVYAGATINTYLLNNLVTNDAVINSLDPVQINIANGGDFLTTRVSYKLNLTGPSHLIQSACSTSLVAVHVACQSLLNDECDMALAGGVSINVRLRSGYRYLEGGMMSPDGHCRAFDANAQGTVFGSGVGIVVLKRLADAVADRDHVYAIIKGSAINNDGSLKVGYTAPSVDGQAQVIAEALASAGVRAETISYVETHGTGTPLGDPIEVQALTKAFRADTDKRRYCAIGSVKTNIGHLDAAAGVAGLIKTVLALKHKQLPPSLHFERPNPAIDFDNSPFFVNASLSAWDKDTNPRRAGVSAFGVGGTNAHVILEEAAPTEAAADSRPWKLLVLSAKTASALKARTSQLITHLKQYPDVNLSDLAYTLQVGRKTYSHRLVGLCRDVEDAIDILQRDDSKRVFSGTQDAYDRPVAFMFPGQGAQHPRMGAGLYEAESAFRDQIDLCSEMLEPYLGLSLRDLLYEKEDGEAATLLNQTWITQPALFAVEYGLASLWASWGVRPQAMIGHSVGEYVAACLAGVLSLEDALALISLRGRMMQELPGGAMLAVPLPEDEVTLMLGERLSLAAVNGPSQCVISGPADAVKDLERLLATDGIDGRPLLTSHAFHSEMMEPIIDDFVERVGRLDLKPPTIPYISNVTGTWIKPEEATSPAYWGRHLRQTVRFSQGLQEMVKDSTRVLLEVGPKQTLTGMARRQLRNTASTVAVASLERLEEHQPDLPCLLAAAGKLWLAGARIEWEGLNANQRRRRIPLPTYPFEGRRYWIQPGEQPIVSGDGGQALSKKKSLRDWFYMPAWGLKPLSAGAGTDELFREKRSWLVFLNDAHLGSAIASRLEEAGQNVTIVIAGGEYARPGARRYVIDPQSKDDYVRLIRESQDFGDRVDMIAYLWDIAPADHSLSTDSSEDEVIGVGFHSLLLLAQALEKEQVVNPVRINVISNNIHSVTSEEMIDPDRAAVFGICKVIPQEYPNISCRCVDVVLPAPKTHHEEKLVDHLLLEFHSTSREIAIAYRGNQRWVQDFKPLRLHSEAKSPGFVRDGGVYLISGGLGGIGMALAMSLAQMSQIKLALIDNLALPEKDRWPGWLASHEDQNAVSLSIRKLQKLEGLGAEVFVLNTSLAATDQMGSAITAILDQFGEIDGVIYAGGGIGEESLVPVGELSLAECRRQFGAKKKSLAVLENILERARPRFCLMASSLSSVLGGRGYAAYAAANLFADAFALRQNKTSRVPRRIINFDAWQFDERHNEPSLNAPGLAQVAMTLQEGIEAFQHILYADEADQIIISTVDLSARIDQWLKAEPQTVMAGRDANATASVFHPRPKLDCLYVAPGSELERHIADIWQKALGIEQVGVHDNFFDLGGDSLAAIQVISQLKRALGTDIPVVSLYERLTIKSLVELLNADQETDAPDDVVTEGREERMIRRKQYQQKRRLQKKQVGI